MSQDDYSQWIVISGNPLINGCNFYGPFSKYDEAKMWVDEEFLEVSADKIEYIKLIKPWHSEDEP